MNPFAGLGEPRPEIHAKPRAVRGNKPPQTGWTAPVPNPWELSGIQCEILKRFAEGASNSEVAVEFGLSTKTIEAHMARIKDKMAVANRTHAVALWVRHEVGSAS